MEKPYWLKLALAILGINLYTGDTIGAVLVGLDLIERCHYFYATSIFSFAIMPGFAFVFLGICSEAFKDGCSLKIRWAFVSSPLCLLPMVGGDSSPTSSLVVVFPHLCHTSSYILLVFPHLPMKSL